jgi:hypothetical protein
MHPWNHRNSLRCGYLPGGADSVTAMDKAAMSSRRRTPIMIHGLPDRRGALPTDGGSSMIGGMTDG